MGKNNRQSVGLILFILSITVILGCSSEEQKAATTQSRDRTSEEMPVSTSIQPITAPTHSLGEVISITQNNLNLQLTVNSTRVHSGKGVIKPNTGNQWIVVDTTIVNQGKTSQTFSVVSFRVMDDKNQTYEVAFLASALEDIETPTGEISPGSQKKGQLVFEVPQNIKNLQLLFQPYPIECEEKSPNHKALDCQPIVVKL